MAATTYTLRAFDYGLAAKGKLCVVVNKSYSGTTIDNTNTAFVKASVCTITDNNEVSIVIGSNNCLFDKYGISVSSFASNYKLLMGSAGIEVQQYGNAIKRAQLVKTIKTTRGIETKVLDYPVTEGTKRASSDIDDSEPEKNVMVTALNARDNFALRALQCIIPSIPNIKDIGDDERDFYCKIAYQWAANMMDNAAQVRATFEDETHSTEISTDITELETNTDKLLNNILYTMERVQKTTIESGQEIVSNRITTPDLTEALLAQTTSVVTAVNSVKTTLTAIKDAIIAQTTALNNITTAIENLELSPVINNNITIPENNGGA